MFIRTFMFFIWFPMTLDDLEGQFSCLNLSESNVLECGVISSDYWFIMSFHDTKQGLFVGNRQSCVLLKY